MRLRGPRESWTSCGAALVAAQRADAFEAREELVATVFSEPKSRDGRVLQRRHRDEGISSLVEGTLQNEIAALAPAYARHADDVELFALARAAITTLSGATTTAEITLDRRIERAVALVREQLDQAVQRGEIAAAVHLPRNDFDISSWNRPACDSGPTYCGYGSKMR